MSNGSIGGLPAHPCAGLSQCAPACYRPVKRHGVSASWGRLEASRTTKVHRRCKQGSNERCSLLSLRANRVVSSETPIDVLWGEDAPETAMHTLHVYVSQLRKVLRQVEISPIMPVATEGRRYMFRIDPDDIDLDRCERIAAAGRQALEEGEDADAAARLGEALGLWCGQPLSDSRDEGRFPRE